MCSSFRPPPMEDQSISLDLLRGLQPLAQLDTDRLRELVATSHRDCMARGSVPFDILDRNGRLTYLIKGELMLQFADTSTAVIVGGCEDAQRPLGRWGTQPISAKAITDIELICFDAEMLDIMLTWDQLLLSAARPNQTGESHVDGGKANTDWRLMSGMFTTQNLTRGAFAALPPAHIDQLLQRFQRIGVKRDDVVVRQGEPGDYYYLIESGRCQVTRLVAGTPLTLAELKPGDAFGEEALVTESTRNANVTMKTDGMLLRLDKQDFIELLRAPLLHTLSLAEAQRRAMAGAVWLDVRFAAEYQFDGIKGARNLPLDEIREAYAALDPQKEYIVYCQSGRRSSAAAFLLSKRGFRASLLEGGLRAGVQREAENEIDKGAP
ncbi:MAG: cyclic nucleotide-binding domain-containing protein [Proteobacteria bacterium]|nr:cyclic nucleotide-binding domain-containing protein [Pseudomonadota bacterium]